MRRRRKRGLELVEVVGVARLMVRVDSGGGEEPVRVVVGMGAEAHGHLVNDGAYLRMGETVAVLEERRGRGVRGQYGVRGGGQGAAGWIGEQGVCAGGT